MEETTERVMEEKFWKLNQESARALEEVEKERNQLKSEVEVLRNELAQLKMVHSSQAEIMRIKKEKWEGEREALKEEEKKLEYSMFDLFNANDALKEKVRKIKSICDE